jgi:tripartite-type tricarboxylate transporter receptor subunit TctC
MSLYGFDNRQSIAGACPLALSIAHSVAARIAFWDDAPGKVVSAPEWLKEVEENGWEPEHMNSVESRKFIERRNAALKGLLTELGLASVR